MLQEKQLLPNNTVHEYEGKFWVCHGIVISMQLLGRSIEQFCTQNTQVHDECQYIEIL